MTSLNSGTCVGGFRCILDAPRFDVDVNSVPVSPFLTLLY